MKKKFFNEKKIAIFKKSAKNENFSEFFRFFQNFQDFSRIFQIFSDFFRIFKIFPDFFRIFQNFQDFSKILNLILMFEVRNSD